MFSRYWIETTIIGFPESSESFTIVVMSNQVKVSDHENDRRILVVPQTPEAGLPNVMACDPPVQVLA